VEGKLQTRKWRDTKGQQRSSVEVTVLRVHFFNTLTAHIYSQVVEQSEQLAEA
jgi:single-stranded DNA-binding protein